MGKPKAKNAFFYYMQYKQQELKKNGQDLGVNDPRLHKLAGDDWAVMSKEEREPFGRKAKADKDRVKNQPVIQLVAKSYTQPQFNIDDEEDRQLYLDKLVECCVKACKTREELLNASFFIMSSNVMTKVSTKDGTDEWIPLEIGISQYSIKNGIQFTYNEFIDAGKVPMGYMYSAKSWAEATHKIPLDNFYAATNDYQKVVEDISQILNNSRFTNEMTGKPTPMMVFCATLQEIEQNKGVLEWLAKKYRERNPGFEWELEVLELVNLLFYISDTVGKPISPAIAESKLSTPAFDYSADTNCDYHEETDNKNCSRGYSRRYCYMLSQALCPLFEITPTGSHLPPKRTGVLGETYKPKLSEVRSTPSHSYRFKPEEREEPTPEPVVGTSRPQSKLLGIGRGRGTANRF